ncbi:MAG: hypothetical protein A3G49_02050 [Candidatus Sungbacteria bacterium RIFCSPLOWO2_12_FULL_41_11]|uniref:Uncharacterized protein n=1 Tax=Candidatus Sungbacteria bacterium RIFCSPLOWO2_12_FULL_41_11 TaxID=1802286 RepID=A0A1G2LRY7_9BACT|nr:MAG: hypothetical protein UV01_C0007G0024 [Parcubacteria group bacterium GW2011_GWA2_42_14]OHA00102.1 MAG: hypothetical protein A3D41_00515 [Candidatus Sungbacteria bacterium RIFCSPHIGHO2_02_FULL_41_12b]OHA14386.1 MAG: hypothetical protein A3G49_02050 [Candidatus Sungbacteria bacterium RIFCSPLOWO2_12_FULL_41_11]
MLSDGLTSKTALIAKRNEILELKELVSKTLEKWTASAEESARNNQPYNHQVLYTIKKELNKLFEEELKKLQ